MPDVAVFIGPSGVGKSSLVIELVRRHHLTLTPTWTTRPRRHYEGADSPDHVFVDDEAFSAFEAHGGFLATAQPFGLPYRYGLPRLQTRPGTIAAIILRASLLGDLAQHFPAHVVYQVEADLSRVTTHLRTRESHGAAVRLESHALELEAGRRFAHRIICNHGPLDEAVEQAAAWLAQDFKPRADELGIAA